MISSPEIIALLFFIAIVAGWVDVIAGGGGLLTIPALLMAGLPPAVAIATNKLQTSVSPLIASIYFVRKDVIDLTKIKLPICMAFIGSIIGSWMILTIDASILFAFIPILLIAVALYFLFSPQLSDAESKPKIPWRSFVIFIVPLLGFYDGFFGAGTGSFIACALVLCVGYGLTAATAHAKILNFTSSIASLTYFIVYGEIAWLVGAVMMCGQIIGGTIGAKMVLQKGAALIKPTVVIVCLILSANMLIKML